MVERVNSVLAAHLRDFASGLHEGVANERVIGYIVSSEFEGLSTLKRQKMLAEILEQNLTEAELARIGPIITMTPAQAAVDEPAD